MANFATAADVATYLRTSFDAADTASVNQVLDGATAIIRGYTGQYIEAQTALTETFEANRGTYVVKERPITTLTHVKEDGVLLVLDTDYRVDMAAGIVQRIDYNWKMDSIIEIKYNSGYATIPNDIRLVCIEVAKRAFENPAGIQREDLNTASQWLGLTEQNKAVLNYYRMQ